MLHFCDVPSAAYNPLASLDPDSPDIAEDAALLADALVCDPPGATSEVHWNEEAKALITGIVLYVATEEFGSRRSLATLRDYLTLDVHEFADLLSRMQQTEACNGLIRRAANRHKSKSDREAAGVLSAAQRHTHFLDSPRVTEVLGRSDFHFGDLKQQVGTVLLVLPPDRLDTYSRWLRLLVTQSLTEMVRATPIQMNLTAQNLVAGHALYPSTRVTGETMTPSRQFVKFCAGRVLGGFEAQTQKGLLREALMHCIYWKFGCGSQI